MHTRPSAHLPSERLVAQAVGLCSPGLTVGLRGIELQEGTGLGPKPGLRHSLQRVESHGGRREHGALIGIRPDENGHVVLLALGIDRIDIFRQAPAVYNRSGIASVRADESGPHVGLDSFGGLGAQLGKRAEFRSCLFRLSQALHGFELASAFANHPVEQSAREGASRQQVGAPGAGRLAEDGDRLRIAAESRDILLHPLQGGDLIEQAEIGGSGVIGFPGQFRMREETEHAQAIVDGHHDDTLPGQLFAIVGGHRRSPGGQRAAVDPHHHRELVIRRFGCRIDIQIQAVLFHRSRLGADAGRIRTPLHADGGELRGLANAGPFGSGLRSAPSKIPNGS